MKNLKIRNLQLSEKFYELANKKIELKKEKSKQKANKVIKDIRENRNWSWYNELVFRNQDNLESTALFYRGVEITYAQMFNEMKSYAKTLKSMGVKTYDAIPICMPSNTPEFVYLLGAVSMIGAVAHIYSADFDKDYVKEIINSCDSKILFIEDNEYEKISDVIKNTKIENIVMTSLSDSFINNKDIFEEFDKPYKNKFKNKVYDYIKENNKIIDINTFKKYGKSYSGELISNTTLDDIFTITYSSGTTSTRPKPIKHAVKSFNIVTRFHDKEINHTPSYRMFSMQASIPTFSSTGLISGISDGLTQGCKVALEPIYEENFVVDSITINQPSYLDLTRSFWIRFAKDVLYNPKYKDLELPSLTICFAVGEPTEMNEEILINKALKKVKAGKKILKVPLPIVKLSTAGGDCEHGGIFYRLFREYSNLNPIHKIKQESAGLGTFDMVDVAILDEDGNHCIPYKTGKLVATSELNMIGYSDLNTKGYKNNEEATRNFYITDNLGKLYGDCKVDAYKDLKGYIHIKGRQDGNNPTYEISDIILKNKKDVLSCEIVNVDDYAVAHVEFQPNVENEYKKLFELEEQCIMNLGEEKASKVIYRIHDNDNSFKLTHSGKRDKLSLINEGISDKCIKPVRIDGDICILNASEYKSYNALDKTKTKILKK